MADGTLSRRAPHVITARRGRFPIGESDSGAACGGRLIVMFTVVEPPPIRSG